ncbi:MAG TPA: carboxypeptidase-like regulatory domain-containing protein [Chitinophagales bacterium]|nr:carboxypeptidase-like regulatory domain-containing protein [Chitinophagales bacterium]
MRHLVMLFCCMAACILLHAQNGTIQGRVLDNLDGGLAKAKIAVVDSLGNTVKGMSTTSDFAGDYTLKQLPAGNYNVLVTLKNYTLETATNVQVAAGKATFINFRLTSATDIRKQ